LRNVPAVTLDGERVALHINAGLLFDLPHLDQSDADGIGLLRTEHVQRRATLVALCSERCEIETYRRARKAASLFSSFAKNGTWQVPTLVALHQVWDGKRGALSPRDIQSEDRLWAKYAEMLGSMRKAGIGIMAGTDVPLGLGVAPLHEELVLLVKAGIPPMEALQSATRNPAEFLGTLQSEGTVEVGKLADLVLLSANPLVDIANTRRISAVIRSGTLIEPDASPRAR